MADSRDEGSVVKADEAGKLPGSSGEAMDKGKNPGVKLPVILEDSENMEVLKKTLKELRQSNTELKLQLVEQEEKFLNHLAQQEVQFGQIRNSRRKVDLDEDQKSSNNDSK